MGGNRIKRWFRIHPLAVFESALLNLGLVQLRASRTSSNSTKFVLRIKSCRIFVQRVHCITTSMITSEAAWLLISLKVTYSGSKIARSLHAQSLVLAIQISFYGCTTFLGTKSAKSPHFLHFLFSSEALNPFTASLICVPRSVQWKASSLTISPQF